MTPQTDPPRRGRPRADQAGEVEQRILDAATTLILTQGYAKTTVDQVAAAARTGKTTLYGRFPTKPDLFAAVIRRSTAEFARAVTIGESNGSAEERLVKAGIELAEVTLTRFCIDLMLVTAAESDAFPELAIEVGHVGFSQCAAAIAACLVEITTVDTLEAATPLGERFVQMALHPLYLQAFYGEDLARLREQARIDVALVARMFFTSLVTPADLPLQHCESPVCPTFQPLKRGPRVHTVVISARSVAANPDAPRVFAQSAPESVHAGFPSPATGYYNGPVDLNRHLMTDPTATFIVRVSGDSMIGAGIWDGDEVIVDRSLNARDGSVVVAVVDTELTIKRLRLDPDGAVRLVPENPAYPEIVLEEMSELVIWGVVTRCLHRV